MRARTAAVSIGLAAAAALSATGARAQENRQAVLNGKHRSFESPQHFAIELRFAPFTPNIDSDPALSGATPYHDVFGSTPRLLFGMEFDWQAVRIPHFGSIGPGLGAGYTAMNANATFTTPHNGSTVSGENTSLAIYPFYVVAVVRADVFSRDFRIPLVPYAKAGVGYALWQASNTLGGSVYMDPSTGQSVSGKGSSLGTQLALGLALNLNPFDEYAAKNFDEAMGVNSTMLFAEWTRADLTGLGVQQNVLRVGATTWTFGLAFEF